MRLCYARELGERHPLNAYKKDKDCCTKIFSVEKSQTVVAEKVKEHQALCAKIKVV